MGMPRGLTPCPRLHSELREVVITKYVNLVLTRHGQSIANLLFKEAGFLSKMWNLVKTTWNGTRDHFLSPLGMRQAIHTDRLHKMMIKSYDAGEELIFLCSPLSRAIQTWYLATDKFRKLIKEKDPENPEKLKKFRAKLLVCLRERQTITPDSKAFSLTLDGTKDRIFEAIKHGDRTAFDNGETIETYIDLSVIKEWFDNNSSPDNPKRWDGWTNSRKGFKRKEKTKHFKPVVKDFLNYVWENYADLNKRVFAFGHGMSFRMILTEILGKSRRKRTVKNATSRVVSYSPEYRTTRQQVVQHSADLYTCGENPEKYHLWIPHGEIPEPCKLRVAGGR